VYEVFEYASKGSLTNYLEKFYYKEDQKVIWELFVKILKGIANIHDSRIIHADLKTDNIMIMENGDPRIINFESSVLKDKQETVRGSPAYMAHELFNEYPYGFKYTEKVDAWACGIILYKMLFKKNPFGIYVKKNAIELYFRGLTIEEGTHNTISNTILDMLEINPNKIKSAHDVLREKEHSLIETDEVNHQKIQKDIIGEEFFFILNFMSLSIDPDATYAQTDLNTKYPNLKVEYVNCFEAEDYLFSFSQRYIIQIVFVGGLLTGAVSMMFFHTCKKRYQEHL